MSKDESTFGAPITAKKAMVKIDRYRAKYPGQTKSCTFPADTIIRLGKQLEENKELTKAVFFLGMNENGAIELIAYPATQKGNLRSVTLSAENSSLQEDGGPTGDNFTASCPPLPEEYCPKDPDGHE